MASNWGYTWIFLLARDKTLYASGVKIIKASFLCSILGDGFQINALRANELNPGHPFLIIEPNLICAGCGSVLRRRKAMKPKTKRRCRCTRRSRGPRRPTPPCPWPSGPRSAPLLAPHAVWRWGPWQLGHDRWELRGVWWHLLQYPWRGAPRPYQAQSHRGWRRECVGDGQAARLQAPTNTFG